MRVALDIDNVCLAWQEAWIDAYQLWFDKEVPPTAARSWTGFHDGTHFITADEFWHWLEIANVWANMPPVPGALGGIYELQHAGHDIIFCTARPLGVARKEAELFASSQGAHVDFRNAASKHLTKAAVWIDDSPEVLANLLDHGKPCIRFEQPWNVGVRATWVARDWPEVLAVINSMDREAQVDRLGLAEAA